MSRSLKRSSEDGLAQGLDLPAPARNTLAVFEGHKWAWKRAADSIDRCSALVTGCSYWYKKKQVLAAGVRDPPCLCGGREPSRPHLLWDCERTADLRASTQAPVDRLEERLLAKAVPETPAPPTVVDPQDLIEQMAEFLQARLAAGTDVYVATDGSVVNTVAAWAAILSYDGDGDFALGVAGEDQSSHRAEVEGLHSILRALTLRPRRALFTSWRTASRLWL